MTSSIAGPGAGPHGPHERDRFWGWKVRSCGHRRLSAGRSRPSTRPSGPVAGPSWPRGPDAGGRAGGGSTALAAGPGDSTGLSTKPGPGAPSPSTAWPLKHAVRGRNSCLLATSRNWARSARAGLLPCSSTTAKRRLVSSPAALSRPGSGGQRRAPAGSPVLGRLPGPRRVPMQPGRCWPPVTRPGKPTPTPRQFSLMLAVDNATGRAQPPGPG